MNCVFCGDNSGIDLPEYKKVCNLCYEELEVDYDKINDYLIEEEEEILKNGTND